MVCQRQQRSDNQWPSLLGRQPETPIVPLAARSAQTGGPHALAPVKSFGALRSTGMAKARRLAALPHRHLIGTFYSSRFSSNGSGRTGEQPAPRRKCAAPDPARLNQVTIFVTKHMTHRPDVEDCLMRPPTPVQTTSTTRRVALVIGNSAYTHVKALPNPVNNARSSASW